MHSEIMNIQNHGNNFNHKSETGSDPGLPTGMTGTDEQPQ